MITLPHIDPGWPGALPLAEVPARLVAKPTNRYIHVVRSAVRTRHGISVSALCGVHLNRITDSCWQHRRSDGDRPLCGTCEGRWMGLTIDGIRFAPTKSLTSLGNRAWCPGRNLGLWTVTSADRRDGRCVLCGFTGRLRYCGGPYRGRMEIVKHQPLVADALVSCRTCGWKHLTVNGSTVSCSAHDCGFRAEVSS